MNGADMTARDEDGRSPLHVAVDVGNESVVWLLLKEKSAYDMGNTTGPVSSRRHDLEVVQMLLKVVHVIQSVISANGTALHWAATHGHEEVVRLLTEGGADIESINETGMTALHCSALNEHERVVQLLLDEGAGPNAVACNRVSEVRFTTSRGYEALTRLLSLQADIVGNMIQDFTGDAHSG